MRLHKKAMSDSSKVENFLGGFFGHGNGEAMSSKLLWMLSDPEGFFRFSEKIRFPLHPYMKLQGTIHISLDGIPSVVGLTWFNNHLA